MTIPDRGAVLFTTRDIQDATSAYRDEQYALMIRLTPAAAQRMQQVTRTSVGSIAELAMDGQVLVSARTGRGRDTPRRTARR
jgi:preprotein translocase subunit SecD